MMGGRTVKGRKTKRPEQELQRECVKWFRLQYPKYIIHHSPNGIRSSVVQGAIFKANGVIAGFPDLVIIIPDKVLFIEMKAKGGGTTEAQDDVLFRITAMGHPTAVINNFDSFMDFVKRHI